MATEISDHTVIVGAGIVGVSTAIWLLRAGKSVTLIDRQDPGEGASFGNAGILASCSVAPVTAPGMILKAPKMLMDPDFPLFLRWSYLPKLTPWLIKYLGHANAKDTIRISEGLAPLTADSVDQHASLAGNTDAAEWVKTTDYSFAYLDKAAFEADSFTWALRRNAGFEPDLLEGEAVREAEPLLGKHINLLAVMRDHGFVRSPGEYVKALSREVLKLGGKLLKTDVNDIELTDDKVTAVLTDQGRVDCTSLVLATGAWSKALSNKLNISIPLETERGYHIEFEPEEKKLKAPVMVTAGKFVATPMAGGLRCAGVVEFGGLEAEASRKPLKLLQRTVRSTFPSLKLKLASSWLGHRPAPSDSLPLIGNVRNTGVFTAFGHHHVGLTCGPKTGRLVADMLCQSRTNLDLAPYDPNRFAS